MADYTDVSAVRLALSPGGDESDTGSAASLADADLQAAIDDATDEVNGKITARYPLPIAAPVPSILARICRDIAAYFATLTYRRGDPLLPGDPVALRYKAAEDLLTQIQTGMLSLGTDSIDGPGLSPIWPDPNSTTLYDGDNGPIDYPPVLGGPRFLPIN